MARAKARTTRAADPVEKYARAVASGRIVAGPYVRLACERHMRDLRRKDLTWNRKKAVAAIEFFREMLVLEGGEPFELQPWQAFVVGSCFGWYTHEGFRRYRTAYVESGKGSGKTPLAAGVGLYGLLADGEPAPEVYSAATMKDQAKICFKDAVRMVEASPELAALIDVAVGSLTIQGDAATFRPVSSEHKGLDGLRVHVGIVDELHEHPTAIVVDKIRAGTKRRRNALIFEITNSGWDRTSVCWQHHEMSVRVLEGTAENDSWFAYVCVLDEGDDWTDEAVWLKANPSLGTVLPISYLREQVADAKGMPSKENIVKRLNFCIWTEQEDRWLDMTAYDACGVKPLDVGSLAGLRCMAGLDAASTQDLSALVLLFGPDEDGYVRLVPFFWLPAQTLEASEDGRTEEDRLKLKQWADQGYIRLTDGNVTDYDVMEEQILEELAKYNLHRLAFDRWGLTQLVTHLMDKLGMNGEGEPRVVAFAQSMAEMSAPSKEFERLIRDGKLLHGNNPVLRWMASNVAIQYGPNEQIKPNRERSRDKIDGVIASIMAVGMSMRQPPLVEQSYSVEWVG